MLPSLSGVHFISLSCALDDAEMWRQPFWGSFQENIRAQRTAETYDGIDRVAEDGGADGGADGGETTMTHLNNNTSEQQQQQQQAHKADRDRRKKGGQKPFK